MDADNYTIEVDDLTYTYDPQKKNLLKKVFDASNHPFGFKDDSTGISDPTDDYTYDDNGNMTSDTNKGITNISYNHLNLPVFVEFSTTAQSISYIYNANGQKLKKAVNNGAPLYQVTNTVYLQGFHYTDAKLSFFSHPEGYVNITTGKNNTLAFNYVFNYTDHLGNIRVSYTKNLVTNINGERLPPASILEENHYYPFGLKHTKYNSTQYDFVEISHGDGYYVGIDPVAPGARKTYQYKLNGKEWQDDLGLNMYDFEARMYMPDIGRTTTYDPLAEKFYDFSPQSFFNNNPVYFVDPTGMAAEQNEWKPKVNEDGSTSYIAEKGDTSATFAKQYNVSESDAMSIVGNITYEGMEVTGQQVFDVLGTESLKLDLNSGLDTPQRKIDHFIYAMHHSKSKGANYFRATDYFQNILQGELQTPQDIRGNITLDNGQTATIQMKLPFYTSTGSFFTGGTDYHYAFYSNKTITSPSQGNGTMFGGLQPINHYIIGYGFIFNGKPVLQGGSQHGIWMSILSKHDSSFERTILDRQVPEFRYHNFKPKSKM